MTIVSLWNLSLSGILVLFITLVGDSGLGIMSSMNVRFLVVDPLGRRTGFDAATGRDTTGIPSSRYSVQSIGQLEGSEEKESREFVASFGAGVSLIDGPYIIHVVGEKAGDFWLSISVYREPVSEDFNIRGTIRAGELKIYQLIYDDDLSVPIRIDTVGSK